MTSHHTWIKIGISFLDQLSPLMSPHATASWPLCSSNKALVIPSTHQVLVCFRSLHTDAFSAWNSVSLDPHRSHSFMSFQALLKYHFLRFSLPQLSQKKDLSSVSVYFIFFLESICTPLEGSFLFLFIDKTLTSAPGIQKVLNKYGTSKQEILCL